MTRTLLIGFVCGLLIAPFFGLGLLGILYTTFFPTPFLLSLSQSMLFLTTALYILLAVLIFIRFFIITPFFPLPGRVTKYDDLSHKRITVCMTAYNDEGVIGGAVEDFLSHPLVDEVVVVDNNCVDNTAGEAKDAGGIVVPEPIQGFGAASIRGLKTAVDRTKQNGNVILFVEGDQTFISRDIDKLFVYISNADMVIGTRTTKELSTADSQVTPSIQYSNVFLAKLLQLKYWGTVRLTDVGCSMRMLRRDTLKQILPSLTITGNTFSPHMMDMVLKHGFRVIEVPVYFQKRGGLSKGIGSDFIKGFPYGLIMIWNMLVQ
jgi:hypothetical protein